MPSGPPKWSSTMVVSGKARARSVSSGICGWNSQASKLRPKRRQLREAFAEGRRPAAGARLGLLCELRICSLACQPAAWRMPRKRPRAAPMCASSTSAHRGAEAQVGEGDDAGGHARVAVTAAGAHRGDAVDELGLAHRAQGLRAVGAIHRRTFDEHRAAHVVACAMGIGLAGIGQQLVEQVAVAVAVPQVVVRVADRQIGVDDLFGGFGGGSWLLAAAAQPQQREQRTQTDADGVGAAGRPNSAERFGTCSCSSSIAPPKASSASSTRQPRGRGEPRQPNIAHSCQRGEGGQVVELVPAQVHLPRRGGQQGQHRDGRSQQQQQPAPRARAQSGLRHGPGV